MLGKAVPDTGRGFVGGVGSGRFGEPFGIRCGIDPSRKLTGMAKEQGIAVSTLAMLHYSLIDNIAAIRIPRERRRYPSWMPGIGALSCIGLIAFLSPDSWIIGCIGLAIGGVWFVLRRKSAS